jgi:hypothetical protein
MYHRTKRQSLLNKTKINPLGIILEAVSSILQRCTYVLKLSTIRVPGFAKPQVAGHKDLMVIGYLDKTR